MSDSETPNTAGRPVPARQSSAARSNLRGCLYMVLAMAAFSLEDVFFKRATQQASVGCSMILFGLGGLTISVGLVRRAGEAIGHASLKSRVFLIRMLCEIGGRLSFALAIALTPLSTASAILQATPFVVAVGAAYFFDERVGWRRWSAIAVGFAGVLLILRPGLGQFDVKSLLAVLATIGFAGRDLATRASPSDMSSRQLGVYGFVSVAVAGLVILGLSQEFASPDGAGVACLAAASVVGVVAYFALTTSVRVGELSVVASCRYTRLVFAMLLGLLVFQETPDTLTLVGSVTIVLSGVLMISTGQSDTQTPGEIEEHG